MTLLLGLSTPGWAALAALGGALVGGLVTGAATYLLEGKRQRFEREQRDTDREREDAATATAAVARVLRTRYEWLAEAIEASFKGGYWLPTAIEPAPPLEDRKLLATFATKDEWDMVDAAEAELATLIQARELVFSTRGGLGAGSGLAVVRVEEVDRDAIVQTVEACRRARAALDRLAGVLGDPFGDE